MYKHKYEQTQIHRYTYTPLCSPGCSPPDTVLEHFTPCAHRFIVLYCLDNQAGWMPDTPSTMIDIVITTTIECMRITYQNTANINEISPYGRHALRYNGDLALFHCLCVLRLGSSRWRAVSCDKAFSPQAPPSPVSYRRTTSNVHPGRWVDFQLVLSQMQPPVTACIPAEWMFHRNLHGELTQDDSELVLQHKLLYNPEVKHCW